MFMPWSEVSKHIVNKISVLHVGAHLAEELDCYEDVERVIWIEANKDRVNKLKSIVPDTHQIIHAIISDENGAVVTWHEANNGQSSSILELGTHKIEHPYVHYTENYKVSTTRLDSIIEDMPNFVNLDIQGAELLALKGMGILINSVDYIYTEVNKEKLYKEGALIKDIDSFLKDFNRVYVEWTKHGWGDALYVRRNIK